MPLFEKHTVVRDVLHSLARFCTLTPAQLSRLFAQEDVYPRPKEWLLFLERFLLALSAVLLVSGVIFFFAYNWADMHKFLKLGLLQLLLLVLMVPVLLMRLERRVREVLLCSGALVLGVLFAVFGQIYQTGANAYDFFQGWAMGVFVWALVGRSSYLWLIFLVLVNLTLHFYAEQVAYALWPDILLPLLLFLLNAAVVAIWAILWMKKKVSDAGQWFPMLVALAAILINTAGVCGAIFSEFREDKGLSLLVTAVVYAGGLWWGNRQHRLFYPATIGLSLIVMGTCLLVQLFEAANGEAILLLSSLFVIGATTALVFYLKQLSKAWYGNN